MLLNENNNNKFFFFFFYKYVILCVVVGSRGGGGEVVHSGEQVRFEMCVCVCLTNAVRRDGISPFPPTLSLLSFVGLWLWLWF